MASISAALAISRLLPFHSTAASPFPFSPSILKKAAVVAVSSPFKCGAALSPQEEEEEQQQPAEPQGSALLGIPTSTWSAGLGSIGFLETGYLTYLKLTDTEAFCPASGASCGDVLNSDYSYVYGLPLPLVGLFSYGLVSLLAFQQSGKNLLPGLGETNTRLLLLGSTTSMATASAYFLYILYTKFAGASCLYCLVSATLSFSLFFITLKDFALEEIRNVVGLQLAIVGIVVTALTNTYATANPHMSSANDITLEFYETEITNPSSPFAISLAKHLNSIRAKMYGAFWCSHCKEQKQMFGLEASKMLDYIECFPNGAGKGKSMAMECLSVGMQGFPTWVIKGKILSGEQDLAALAEASGYIADDS